MQAKRQECYDDTSGDGREQGYTGGIKQQGNTHAGQDAGVVVAFLAFGLHMLWMYRRGQSAMA